MLRQAAVATAFVIAFAGVARAEDAPLAPATAGVDEKAACVAQLDRAQSLQTAHDLLSSRDSYLACSTEACPDLVREDCTRSLVALDASMPTVVFAAAAPEGDVVDVRVVVDGQLVTEKLDGAPVALNPGAHAIRFERRGSLPVDDRILVREGEKNRIVSARFGVLKPLDATPRASEGKRVPALPIAFAATGVVALGSALVFRLRSDAQADELHRCAPFCDQSQRDALSDKVALTNVALGVGIGALALSAATWLLDSRH